MTMNSNSCVKTVTVKKVVNGTIIGRELKPKCNVHPSIGSEVYLNIDNNIYSKADLKFLIDSLTEIHEVL